MHFELVLSLPGMCPLTISLVFQISLELVLVAIFSQTFSYRFGDDPFNRQQSLPKSQTVREFSRAIVSPPIALLPFWSVDLGGRKILGINRICRSPRIQASVLPGDLFQWYMNLPPCQQDRSCLCFLRLKSSYKMTRDDRLGIVSGCTIKFDWKICGHDHGLSRFWTERIAGHVSFKVTEND
jgi:hypothetical protein